MKIYEKRRIECANIGNHNKLHKGQTCNYCNYPGQADHNYVEGVCTYEGCNMICDHDWKPGKCTICDMICKHDEPWNLSTNSCIICNMVCTHDWKSGVCTNCHMVCKHETWNSSNSCTMCGIVCKHDWNLKTSICNTCNMKYDWITHDCINFINPLKNEETTNTKDLYDILVIEPDEQSEEIKTIGFQVFSECKGITSVIISSKITSIGQRAFSGCSSLTTVTIPESITSIGDYAFMACSSLISIEIPKSVDMIGKDVFTKCSSLESIIVNSNNPNYSSDDNGILYNKDKTILICCPENVGNGITEFTIPNLVEEIGENAFEECRKLIKIIIKESVKKIGNSAFSECTKLESITIPDSVTSIDDSAFFYCSKLTSIKIPSSVTSINNSTFYGCIELKSIIIPESVTSIGDSAFKKCSSLESVTIQGTLTSIGDSAFSGCSDDLIFITNIDPNSDIGKKLTENGGIIENP